MYNITFTEINIGIKIMKKILLALTLFLFSTSLYAATIEIEMLNKNPETKKRMVYSAELVKVAAGDTVDWLPTAKGHNVEILVGPSGYDLPKKTNLSEKVSITFKAEDINAELWLDVAERLMFKSNKAKKFIRLLNNNATKNGDDISKWWVCRERTDIKLGKINV